MNRTDTQYMYEQMGISTEVRTYGQKIEEERRADLRLSYEELLHELEHRAPENEPCASPESA